LTAAPAEAQSAETFVARAGHLIITWRTHHGSGNLEGAISFGLVHIPVALVSATVFARRRL
jgi:hypothetical protein